MNASVTVIGLSSPNGTWDAVFLGNYANINLVDAIKRIPGEGDVNSFTAQDYAMRIRLRPDKLAVLGVTPDDVNAAIREQNAQAPAGVIGAEPARAGQEFQHNVRTLGLLKTEQEFGEIIVRANPDGSQIKVQGAGCRSGRTQGANLRRARTPEPAASRCPGGLSGSGRQRPRHRPGG